MTAPAKERLLSLDVFRGLTIAGMLLVNTPGTWSAVYPSLHHAEWHGWTPTDLVFPFFLFIVGITTHLSLSIRRERGAPDAVLVQQIFRRGIIIILLGLFMSAFPFVQWGMPDAPWGERFVARMENLRIMGVLQRIGLVYIASGLLTLRTSVKQQIAIVAGILYGYWMLMTLAPVEGGTIGALVLDQPSRTLEAVVDQAILGKKHIWAGSGTYDPEGFLSTIPAIATAMLGVLAGRWLRRGTPLPERIAALFAIGALGMVVGLMWHWVFPINKNLWTSSYVVFTAGMACVTLATCMWIIDDRRVTWWTKPFVIFGVNPILAYVGSGLLARLIYTVWTVPGVDKPVPVQTKIYGALFASWLSPYNASLAFAISYVLVWLAVCAVLYRKRIFLKV